MALLGVKTNPFSRFWDAFTGQTQETERTTETNKANKESVESTNQANRDIAADTNATNKQIADENLQFQRDLQEYNKALQERIFEREDTSYQRTAQDMMNAGLNPLSMQGTNGAGEAIAMEPLNNSYQAQLGAPMQAAQFQKAQTLNAPIKALSYIGDLTSMANTILTGSLQRDQLRLQNQRTNLENWVYAEKNGITLPFDNKFNTNFSYSERKNPALPKIFQDYNGNWEGDKYYSYPRQQAYAEFLKNYADERTLSHDVEIGRYTDDTEMEKVVTSILDWLTTGRTEEQFEKLIKKYPFLELFMNKE